MGDSIRSVAVKRLRPEFQGHVEAALAFCRHVYATHGKFDRDFRLDNDRLYCSEMVELAYRSAGLPLSEPVPIDQLPGYRRIGDTTKHLLTSVTRIRLDEPVYLPGNDRFGIWSCPYLDPVLEPRAASSPPSQEVAGRSTPGTRAR
jgi:hypothetical protein